MLVMTGGTRGLGAIAAAHLAMEPGSLLMGTRPDAAIPVGWDSRPLDLAGLASVRAFAAALPNKPITCLVLNAGGQRPDVSTPTVDGYEMTFAVNHLAHYLLLRLIMPRLADGARIIITSSGTHDPHEKTGVPAPRHATADLLAYPETDPDSDKSGTVAGMRAYSASKLCNLMTALHLAQTWEARTKGWSVFAYDPGLTPGTGLVRSQSWLVRALIWPLLPLVVPLSKGMNTKADAGRGLAELASRAQAPDERVYAALRKGKLTWPDPSALAQSQPLQRTLWADSARLVGIA